MDNQQGHEQIDAERGDQRANSGVPPDEPRGVQAESRTDAEQNKQIQDLKRNVVIAWGIAAFGPLIAISGLVFSGLQWDVMRQQLADSQAAAADTRRLIAANELQARAIVDLVSETKRAADISAKAARSNERAWLNVMSVGIAPAGRPAVGQPLMIEIELSNFGRTTASGVAAYVAAELLPKGVRPTRGGEPITIGSGTVPQWGNVGTTIAVTKTGSRTHLGPLTQASFDRIMNGSLILQMHGRVEFDDVYGERQSLPICQMYRPNIPPPNGEWMSCEPDSQHPATTTR